MKIQVSPLLLLVLTSAGCAGDFRPVARFPFVEHASIALEEEVLTLDVHEEEVVVDALFHFGVTQPRGQLVMTFPVAPPRGASRDFTAWLGRDVARPLEARRGEPGILPVGEAAETWDVAVDARALAASGGLLEVRYRQPGRGDFAYVWRTGAYWRGPVRRLDVVVRDPRGLLSSLEIDGVRVETSRRDGAGTLVTSLFDVEPESGLKLHVR